MNPAQRLVFRLDQWTPVLAWVEEARARWFVRRFRPEEWVLRNVPLLDIGCGVGDVTRVLKTIAGPATVGIDLEDFRRRAHVAHPPFTFVRADASRLPFQDRSFGQVTILWTLHHASEPATVLQESLRVLAPGGTLTIFEDVVRPGHPWDNRITEWYDALINFEMPRSDTANRTLDHWRQTISALADLQLLESHEEPMRAGIPWLRFGRLRFRKPG
jgi:ubiquinone/menaquinone biosynthesis C-methylase UbiE